MLYKAPSRPLRMEKYDLNDLSLAAFVRLSLPGEKFGWPDGGWLGVRCASEPERR